MKMKHFAGRSSATGFCYCADTFCCRNRTVSGLYSTYKLIGRLAVLVIMLSFTLLCNAQFAGGDGTEDNPWQIAEAIHLNNVRIYVGSRYRDNYFIQTNDINLDVPPYNMEEGWVPIGFSQESSFQGTYNGNDFVITNLFISREINEQGLFGYTYNARIFNIALTEVDITGTSRLGGISGRNQNSEIKNSSVTGRISGRSDLGLLTGYSYEGSRITNSYTTGEINGNSATGFGGLVGRNEGIISGCFSNVSVTGMGMSSAIGGLVGYNDGALSNSYSLGNINGGRFSGGLVGYSASDIINCYSTGRVNAQLMGGGLVGFLEPTANVTNSYWNTDTSFMHDSAGGFGRITTEMIYPYREPEIVYVNWDFEEIWYHDVTREINNGYPFLTCTAAISDNPNTASNPQPQHQAQNVTVNLEEVRWTYTEDILFANPLGFRVYFNTTGEFGDDDFVWVPFIEGEENYSTGDLLPEIIDYRTVYYWKVVPTTLIPDNRRIAESRGQRAEGRGHRAEERGRRQIAKSSQLTTHNSQLATRGDAENVPVWQFVTELNPSPKVASDPYPRNEAEDVAVNLSNLNWRYTIDPHHSNPVGFRVYFNSSGEFGEDDDFHWVYFSSQQSSYSSSFFLNEELSYNTIFYWKVVPTTEEFRVESLGLREFGRERDQIAKSSQLTHHSSQLTTRGDAENVPVWSFKTLVRSPNPLPAANPNPEHLTAGISLGFESVSWDYVMNENYTNPAGFRVYLNTTGTFSVNTPYEWVDYIENQIRYECYEIVPAPLEPNTTYYWRVVPTTEVFRAESKEQRAEKEVFRAEGRGQRTEERGRRQIAKFSNLTTHNSQLTTRGDAENVQTWRFTTGTTEIEEESILQPTTQLLDNYPNPFNPETTVRFTVPELGEIKLAVYNLKGQQIRTLKEGKSEQGEYFIVWDGKDNRQNSISGGIYLLKLRSESFVISKKILLLK